MKTFPVTRIDTTSRGHVILYGPRASLIVHRMGTPESACAVDGTRVQFSRTETAEKVAPPIPPTTTHTVDVSEIPIKSDGSSLPSILV